MTNAKSNPRTGQDARAEVNTGRARRTQNTAQVVPFGIAAARTHDRRREANGETSWTRPAFRGEWDLTVPPVAPPVTVMVEVTVTGPGVRTRRPAYLVAKAVTP